MSLAKVTIEALTQMANTLRQSADDILVTKEQMDSELYSIPWDDPIGLNFINRYEEDFKPLKETLIPNIEEYIQYMNQEGMIVSEYSGESKGGLGVGGAVGAGVVGTGGKGAMVTGYANVGNDPTDNMYLSIPGFLGIVAVAAGTFYITAGQEMRDYLSPLSEEDKEEIKRILNNPKYKEEMKKRFDFIMKEGNIPIDKGDLEKIKKNDLIERLQKGIEQYEKNQYDPNKKLLDGEVCDRVKKNYPDELNRRTIIQAHEDIKDKKGEGITVAYFSVKDANIHYNKHVINNDKVTNTDVVAFFMHEYEHKQQYNRYKRGEISKKVFVHYPIKTNDEKYLCNWKEVAARKYERFTCDTIEGCNDWHKDYLTKADSICEQ